MKYKRGLVKAVEAQQNFEKEQKELKKKHHISDQDDRIIVEKNNMIKFLIRTGAGVIRVAANICICILAVIGLAALIYPLPRAELWILWQRIMEELSQFIH